MEKRNKKLLPKDKELQKYVREGGSDTAKEDFFSFLKRASQPLNNTKSNPTKK